MADKNVRPTSWKRRSGLDGFVLEEFECSQGGEVADSHLGDRHASRGAAAERIIASSGRFCGRGSPANVGAGGLPGKNEGAHSPATGGAAGCAELADGAAGSGAGGSALGHQGSVPVGKRFAHFIRTG